MSSNSNKLGRWNHQCVFVRIGRSAESVAKSVHDNPSTSTCHRAQELNLSRTTLRRILTKGLSMHTYKIQLTKELTIWNDVHLPIELLSKHSLIRIFHRKSSSVTKHIFISADASISKTVAFGPKKFLLLSGCLLTEIIFSTNKSILIKNWLFLNNICQYKNTNYKVRKHNFLRVNQYSNENWTT